MSLISVVVPVYNVSGYLDHCLEYLTRQSYQHLEIICVDDGSTDDSPELLKRWAKKDDRITVYTHPENRSLGAARNTGMDRAKGKYLYFMDSDDYLSLRALEFLLQTAETTQADMIEFTFQTEDAQSRAITNDSPYIPFLAQKVSPAVYSDFQNHLNSCSYESFSQIMRHCFVNNKFFKTDFIRQFRFEEGVYFEDFIFLYQYFLHIQTLVHLHHPEVLFHYRTNRVGSIMYSVKKPTKKSISDLLYGVRQVYRSFRTNKPKYLIVGYKICLDNLLFHFTYTGFRFVFLKEIIKMWFSLPLKEKIQLWRLYYRTFLIRHHHEDKIANPLLRHFWFFLLFSKRVIKVVYSSLIGKKRVGV